MRIAIKATHITSGGGLTHLNKTMEWFARLVPDIQFILLGKTGQDRLFISEPANFDYRYYDFPARSLAAQLWWERFSLPNILKELSADLLFEPGNHGTLAPPCPKITLVHNLAPFDMDTIAQVGAYQKIRLNLLRIATLSSIKSSDGIIFLSEFAKKMISKFTDLTGKKTTIIYHGTPDISKNLDNHNIMQKYHIPPEFILCVSHIYKYKNIYELVLGYIEALKDGADLPPLIIAGAKYDHEYTSLIEGAISNAGLNERIILLGSVSESDLGTLYHNCKYFVFPSILENCPNILLEALGNGCPTLCSNIGVMPEICSNAALYFDPNDISDIASKLQQINSDKTLLEQLRQSAKNRASYFGWEKSTRETLTFFDTVLGRHQFELGGRKLYEMIEN